MKKRFEGRKFYLMTIKHKPLVFVWVKYVNLYGNVWRNTRDVLHWRLQTTNKCRINRMKGQDSAGRSSQNLKGTQMIKIEYFQNRKEIESFSGWSFFLEIQQLPGSYMPGTCLALPREFTYTVTCRALLSSNLVISGEECASLVMVNWPSLLLYYII